MSELRERGRVARAPEGLDLLPIGLRQPGHAQKHQRDSSVGHNLSSLVHYLLQGFFVLYPPSLKSQAV